MAKILPLEDVPVAAQLTAPSASLIWNLAIWSLKFVWNLMIGICNLPVDQTSWFRLCWFRDDELSRRVFFTFHLSSFVAKCL